MKRKQEQGSMQLQGEVLEIAIEEYLGVHFPMDFIEEVKKGALGADTMQIVNTRNQLNCGKIYYESKNTKDFSGLWLPKFKKDMIAKGADVGVLVTNAMPIDMERMGLRDGVWICTFQEFKGLSQVLRQGVIDVATQKKSQENAGEKMSVLYNYLTSTEFKLQIEGIVEGFSQMQNDLESEKRSMKRIWKTREKQIEKVLDNTVGMYGSIKGIAGKSIQAINSLELGEGDEENENNN